MSDSNDLGLLALVVGVGLVIFPEPATTMTGLAIVAASFGLDALGDNS